MSKIDSPSSNNSRTSSETSETQSVEENISIAGNDTRNETQAAGGIASLERAPKKSKRMKEPNNDKDEKDQKRPPWRAVSISTLPKPDKSALLKAKLLDASRRLRQGRSNVSVQTDIVPTKLMKEVNLGTQVDLILHRETGCMTDGLYMKRKEGSEEFVLTYAVSTLTDAIQYSDMGTQTLLPKMPEDSFMKAYREGVLSATNSRELTEIQRKLLQQIFKIKRKTSDESVAIGSNKKGGHKTFDKQTMLRKHAQHSLLNAPTLSAWHFELDDIDQEPKKNFQPYTISPQRPWQSFQPLALNGLYSDANINHRLDWNILLIAIDELIQESNNLVDMIEDMQRSKPKVADLPKLMKQPVKLPSEYWQPIVEEQEKELDALMKSLNLNSSDDI